MKNSGMLFVMAVGNDVTDNDQPPSYPASFNLTRLRI